MFFPFDVSGGLPGRGELLAYTQKRLIEDALDDGQNLGGYPFGPDQGIHWFPTFFH